MFIRKDYLVSMIEMTEYEDVATVKFGRELSDEEKKDFESEIRLSLTRIFLDVEWSKERTD